MAETPMEREGRENLEQVRHWYQMHLGGKQRECASALGLSAMAVNRHVKTLRSEWQRREGQGMDECVEPNSREEVAARALCFARCVAGEFLDAENGCVGACKSVDECQGWRAFVNEANRRHDEEVSPIVDIILDLTRRHMYALRDEREEDRGRLFQMIADLEWAYPEAAEIIERHPSQPLGATL